jgi:hypothetical protein
MKCLQFLICLCGYIQENLTSNNAVWHKSCYLHFNSTKLERARARKQKFDEAIEASTPLSPVKTRSWMGCCPTPGYNKIAKCIFCDLIDKKNLAPEYLRWIQSHQIRFTWLKEILLTHFPSLRAQMQGKLIILMLDSHWRCNENWKEVHKWLWCHPFV